ELRDLGLELLARAETNEPLAEFDGDIGGIKGIFGGEQPLLVFILLAQDARAFGKVVELLLDLGLDQRALLLDHQDQIEPARELQDTLRLQRPGHTDLVEADAELVGLDLVDAKLVERLAHVEVALAAGDDAKLRSRSPAQHQAIEPVGARKRQYGGTFE